MNDPDMDRWTADWREGAAVPADLAKLARRERRLLMSWIALDWIVGAGLVVFAAWLWIDDGSPVMRFTAAGIVLLTVVALAFTTINWRGAFRGNLASAASFLALAEARSRARLRYIRFGWWVLAADLAVIAGAALIEYRLDGPARLPTMLSMATLATAAAAIALVAWGRRERRRADRLAALSRSLGPGPETPHD
jgi:hypothetical protein